MAETQRGIYYPTKAVDGNQPAKVIEKMELMAESIDEAIDDAVAEATYDDTDIKEDINDIKTNYVKNTDYARNNKGGVVKVQPTVYGLGIDGNGFLSPQPIGYNAYLSKTNFYNIDKGTLENVITGKGLANNTQIQELQQENEKLKKALPQIKGTGTNITLNNTSDNKFNELGVGGNTEQEQLTGKNKFSGDYSQFNSTGGEGTTYDYFKLPEDEKTYCLSFIAKNDFTPTNQNFIGFSVKGGTATSANVDVKWAIAGASTSTIIKGTKISINNLIGSTKLRYISLYAKGANSLKTFTDNFYIQLEENDVTDYEPYCGRYSSTKSTVMTVLLKMLQVMLMLRYRIKTD